MNGLCGDPEGTAVPAQLYDWLYNMDVPPVVLHSCPIHNCFLFLFQDYMRFFLKSMIRFPFSRQMTLVICIQISIYSVPVVRKIKRSVFFSSLKFLHVIRAYYEPFNPSLTKYKAHQDGLDLRSHLYSRTSYSK